MAIETRDFSLAASQTASDTDGQESLPLSPLPAELEALLPQTLGSVFDSAFDLYKSHFVTLSLIAALIFLPVQTINHMLAHTWLQPMLVELKAHPGTPDPGTLFTFGFGILVFGSPNSSFPGFIAILSLIIACGPMAVAVSDIYVGKAPTIQSAYRRSLRYFFRLIGGWIVVAFSFIAIFFAAILIISIALGLFLGTAAQAMPTEITMIASVAAIFIPWLIGCGLTAKYYIFTTQLIVLEDMSVSAIPARNSQLVGKNRFKRTASAVFFLPIVTLGLQLLIMKSSDSALHIAALPPLAQFLADTAASTAIGFFFQPYWMIFLTLLYFDYRVRREGLDVRLLAETLPVTTPGSGLMRSSYVRPATLVSPGLSYFPPPTAPDPTVPAPLPPQPVFTSPLGNAPAAPPPDYTENSAPPPETKVGE